MSLTNKCNTKDGESISRKLITVSNSMENAELRESQIRWFYREYQDKKWLPFNGYDSLRLESKYRIWESTLKLPLSSWISNREERKSLGGEAPEDIRFLSSNSSDMMVSVLGGLYEVDVRTGICAPIYWSADKRLTVVLRGIWFKDVGGTLEPFEDNDMVVRLESEHLKLYSGSVVAGQSIDSPQDVREQRSMAMSHSFPNRPRQFLHSAASAPVLCTVDDLAVEDKEPMVHTESTMAISLVVDPKRKVSFHTIRFADCHVDWYSADEMYLYQDSTSLYIRQKLGMQKVGTRLYRGYDRDAQPNDKIPDVTHLCFVVHGIGQKMGTNPILKCCNDFRDMCNRLKSKHFPGLDAANQRVEFLPVEWRSSLQLDGDTVESITPVCVRGLRTTLNSSVMDIMYYNSPLYRAEISCSLLSELNRLYGMFCARNPRFESRGGKVSVLAHSLGCVLVYDLITGWSRPLGDQFGQLVSSHKSGSSLQAASDTGEAQMDSMVPTQLDQDSIASTEKAGTTSGPTGSVASCSESNSSQNLHRLALISSQLEAARTQVNRLEQEMSELVQMRNRNGSIHSGFGDKKATGTGAASDIDSVDILGNKANECFRGTTNSLLFKSNLVNLFCLGSPLSVFLALRGLRPGAYTNQDSILPQHLCPRIFNIYHPADPVAYRLEPLVLKHYRAIQPALVHRADAANKPDYDHMDLVAFSGKDVKRHRLSDCYRTEPDGLSPQKIAKTRKSDSSGPSLKQNNRQRSPSASRGSFASRVLGFFRSNIETNQTADIDPAELNTDYEPGEEHSDSARESITPSFQLLCDEISDELEYSCIPSTVQNTEEFTDVPTGPESKGSSLHLNHRMDFQLRASRYENMYISFFTSHTSYWTNMDVGMFIMTQLFGAMHPPK